MVVRAMSVNSVEAFCTEKQLSFIFFEPQSQLAFVRLVETLERVYRVWDRRADAIFETQNGSQPNAQRRDTLRDTIGR